MNEQSNSPLFMTTKEVAAYLRIKERRVYELLRQRAIPCTKVTGKWLFPKQLIDLWLQQNVEGAPVNVESLPPVIAGSEDPLLAWAAKESGCGLALLGGGSLDGIARLAAGEAVMAGIHLFEPEEQSYNKITVSAALGQRPVVLIEWAMRRQGLLVAEGNPKAIKGIGDLKKPHLRVVQRQTAAGSQVLLSHLLEEAGIDAGALDGPADRAMGEDDLALAILDGEADVCPSRKNASTCWSTAAAISNRLSRRFWLLRVLMPLRKRPPQWAATTCPAWAASTSMALEWLLRPWPRRCARQASCPAARSSH